MSPEKRAAWMAARTKHGGYRGGREQPEHYVWRSMISRCVNPKDKSYKRYGGRGVSVCDRWRSYEAFLADMGPRPTPLHSLDRINVDGPYSPGNCRWATASEQQQNKTGTRRWAHGGRVDTLVGWARSLGLSKSLALWRWKTWGTFEKGKTWQLQKQQ